MAKITLATLHQATAQEVAEGVVFKSLKNPDFSFKAINNKYLLNGGE